MEMPVRIAATYAIIFNVTSTLIQSAFEVWIISINTSPISHQIIKWSFLDLKLLLT